MSIYSDYRVGALTDEEFDFLAAIENRRDRWEREHEYDDLISDHDEEEGEEDGNR